MSFGDSGGPPLVHQVFVIEGPPLVHQVFLTERLTIGTPGIPHCTHQSSAWMHPLTVTLNHDTDSGIDDMAVDDA